MKHVVKMFAAGLGIFSASVGFGNADLGLTATGTRSNATAWLTDTGSPISTASFDFTSVVGTVAAANVDSALVAVQLSNGTSSTTGVNVNLTVPSGCKVGTTSVGSSFVALTVDGTEPSSNTFSFPLNTVKNLRLRFQAGANVGNVPGAVTCTTPGTLSYVGA